MVHFYMLVCRKNFVPHHRKILVIWCNFKRFNAILNSIILMNLICKMKYLTDKFQLFLHWQHDWHSYRKLATENMLCLVFAFRCLMQL